MAVDLLTGKEVADPIDLLTGLPITGQKKLAPEKASPYAPDAAGNDLGIPKAQWDKMPGAQALVQGFEGGADQAIRGVQTMFGPQTERDNALTGASRVIQGLAGAGSAPLAGLAGEIPGGTAVMGGIGDALNYAGDNTVGALANYLTKSVGQAAGNPNAQGIPKEDVGHLFSLFYGPKAVSKGAEVWANAGRGVANTANAATRSLQTGEGARLQVGRELLDTAKAGLQDMPNNAGKTITDQQAAASVPVYSPSGYQSTIQNGGKEVNFPQPLGQVTNNDRFLRNERTLAQTDAEFSAMMRNKANEQTNILADQLKSQIPQGTDPKALVSFAQDQMGQHQTAVNEAGLNAAPQTADAGMQAQTANKGLTESRTQSAKTISDAYKGIDPEKTVTFPVDTVNNATLDRLKELSAADPVNKTAYEKILNQIWDWGGNQHDAAYTVEQLSQIRSNALDIVRNNSDAMNSVPSGIKKRAASQFADAIDGLIKQQTDALGHPEVYDRWSHATDLASQQAEKWNKPNLEDFKPTKLDEQGNPIPDRNAPDITRLDKIVRPGLTGKVEVGSALKASGDHPDVVQGISDRLLGSVDKSSAAKIATYMGPKGYGPILDMPQFAEVKAKLSDLQGKQAAFEVAKSGLLGKLSESVPNPESAISAIVDAPNSIHLIAKLKDALSVGDEAAQTVEQKGVWNSVKALLAEELTKRISSNVVFTPEGTATFKMGATDKMTNMIRDIRDIDPSLADALMSVREGVGIMQRTKEGGYGHGSTTAANVADQAMRDGRKNLFGHVTTGAVIGGTIGHFVPLVGSWIGAAGGAAIEGGLKARANIVRAKLAREAAINPAFAKALMMNAADPRNWALIPKDVKLNLEKNFGFNAAARAAAASQANKQQDQGVR